MRGPVSLRCVGYKLNWWSGSICCAVVKVSIYGNIFLSDWLLYTVKFPVMVFSKKKAFWKKINTCINQQQNVIGLRLNPWSASSAMPILSTARSARCWQHYQPCIHTRTLSPHWSISFLRHTTRWSIPFRVSHTDDIPGWVTFGNAVLSNNAVG